MVLHVRGIVLPERVERSVWIDGGVIREDPVPGADTVVNGGWLVPGLADVHTHPGAERPGDPFDESLLRRGGQPGTRHAPRPGPAGPDGRAGHRPGAHAQRVRGRRVPGPGRRSGAAPRFLPGGLGGDAPTARAAYEAGVTVLAGTD